MRIEPFRVFSGPWSIRVSSPERDILQGKPRHDLLFKFQHDSLRWNFCINYTILADLAIDVHDLLFNEAYRAFKSAPPDVEHLRSVTRMAIEQLEIIEEVVDAA